MPINAQVHGPALRATFLAAFDNFAVDAGDVASIPEVGNMRYARELLGLLETASLLEHAFTNDDPDAEVWQVANPGTYDNATREQAEAVIDAWLSVVDNLVASVKGKRGAAQRRAAATKRNPAGLPLCLCGCGTPGKSDYRPGHDARHAGNLARAVLSGEMTIQEATSGLSGALAAKVKAQVARGNNKVTTGKGTATPTQSKRTLVGRKVVVKVGRWEYDGEITSVTIGDNGKENTHSEPVDVRYFDKKGEAHDVTLNTGKGSIVRFV